jgi:hypothetical protein
VGHDNCIGSAFVYRLPVHPPAHRVFIAPPDASSFHSPLQTAQTVSKLKASKFIGLSDAVYIKATGGLWLHAGSQVSEEQDDEDKEEYVNHYINPLFVVRCSVCARGCMRVGFDPTTSPNMWSNRACGMATLLPFQHACDPTDHALWPLSYHSIAP